MQWDGPDQGRRDDKADGRERIKQQLGTAYPHLEGVTHPAGRPRPSATTARLPRPRRPPRLWSPRESGRTQEWFEATVDEVQAAIVAVRNGQSYDGTRTADFGMRPEQEEAVALTAGYYRAHAGTARTPKFLWNAKMRFGKTFTTYQLAREMGWTRVLVLTYKPAVQTAWKEDLLTHVDFEGWRFVDREYPAAEDRDAAADAADPLVWFASFQDLRGKTADGDIKEHNEVIHLIDWDCDRPRRVPLRGVARLRPRPLRPDRQVRDRRGRGAGRGGHRGRPRVCPATTTCICRARRSARSPTASSPRTRSSTGPTWTSSARRKTGTSTPPGPTRTSTCHVMQMYTLPDGRGRREVGR